ncbi:MAG: cytosine permease [Henriciella sp.]|nr:cytosine permease [Henriciella sp.]
MDETSEFEAVAITEDQFVPWPRIAAVAAMVAFSLPTFITGLEVYEALSPVSAALALLVGSIIIFVIGALMGAIGARTHMSSYLLVRVAFGDTGAGLVNIAFAISLLGWFGININLFADASGQLSKDVFGLDLPSLFWIVIASFCMTFTTLVGFKAINLLATAMVPVLAIVTGLLIYTALDTQSLAEFFTSDHTGELSFGYGVSAVVGAIIIGAIILPDITRFARHWSGAVYTALIAYVVVQLIVMGAAALAGGATGMTDILEIMLNMGLGLGAFLIVIAGSWVLNSLNLYSAVLSMKATFPKLPTVMLTIGMGLIGILAGVLNLLDHFVTFLFYLSIIFVPVAGVILIDALFVRPKAYVIETLSNNANFNPAGFVSWLVGATAAILMSEGLIPSPTSMAAMDAAILTGLLYALLILLRRFRPEAEALE